jgi:hypothetical protein
LTAIHIVTSQALRIPARSKVNRAAATTSALTAECANNDAAAARSVRYPAVGRQGAEKPIVRIDLEIVPDDDVDQYSPAIDRTMRRSLFPFVMKAR